MAWVVNSGSACSVGMLFKINIIDQPNYAQSRAAHCVPTVLIYVPLLGIETLFLLVLKSCGNTTKTSGLNGKVSVASSPLLKKTHKNCVTDRKYKECSATQFPAGVNWTARHVRVFKQVWEWKLTESCHIVVKSRPQHVHAAVLTVCMPLRTHTKDLSVSAPGCILPFYPQCNAATKNNKGDTVGRVPERSEAGYDPKAACQFSRAALRESMKYGVIWLLSEEQGATQTSHRH